VIDLVIAGCGAGGSALLQRLARAGWRVARWTPARSGTPTVAGAGPWGDPHGYPYRPHPVGGNVRCSRAARTSWGITAKVGPVAIANGRFGNRPHSVTGPDGHRFLVEERVPG
jgi:hypothetical protein